MPSIDFGPDFEIAFCKPTVQPISRFFRLALAAIKTSEAVPVQSYWYDRDFAARFASDSSPIAYACSQTGLLPSRLPAVVSSALLLRSAYRDFDGSGLRFPRWFACFRFHASDSEASSRSIASSGFAQSGGGRLQASEDETPPRPPAATA